MEAEVIIPNRKILHFVYAVILPGTGVTAIVTVAVSLLQRKRGFKNYSQQVFREL